MDPTLKSEQELDPLRKAAVACPNCRQGYRLPVRLLGRKLVCRHCRQEFRAEELDSSAMNQLRTASSQKLSNSPRITASAESPSNGDHSDSPPRAGSQSIAIDTRWVGQKLGRYKILSILGQGGMGVVWRGHDDTLRRDVALKILNRSKTKNGSIGGLSAELFMQEARAVAKLQHPSVVSIFEVAEDQGEVFLALELMEGGTLKEYVDKKENARLAPRELFELMIGPAKALALAHDRGIIHRDIKPGNLMFDDHGHLKLMDFGLADVQNEVASEKIRGKAVGSLGWIAPETARGKGTTPQSDIYGMGLVLLYALTGKPLVHARSRSKLIALHQNPPEPDYSSIPDITPSGLSILRKCLAVDPAERFQTAHELVAALQRCADEDPRARTRERRSHATVAVLAVIIGALVGVGGVVYYFLDLIERQNEAQMPVFTLQSSSEDWLEDPREHTDRRDEANSEQPASISPGVQDEPKSDGDAVRFASLAEARVPWPQVPELVDPSTFAFVGSAHGKVFHLPTSACGRMIRASNLVSFKSLEEAEASGRHLCRECAKIAGREKAELAAGSEEAH